MELEVRGVGKCGKQKLSHVKGSIIMMLRGVAIEFVSTAGVTSRNCRQNCDGQSLHFQ